MPMVSHIDHTEHDVNIIITEQGVADLRGKSPKERAQAIIENCVHPDYKNILWDYLKLTDGKSQTPHALRAALAMHAELAKSGDMKNVDWHSINKPLPQRRRETARKICRVACIFPVCWIYICNALHI